MAHKFEYKHKDNLASDERKRLLPARDTLLRLGLKKGDRFIDLGCGIGYFSFPASDIVGESGKVVSADISEDMLGDIKKTIVKKRIKNINVLKVGENSIPLPGSESDFVFCCNVLHEVNDLDRTLAEIKRLLINGGRIAIIEWGKEYLDKGPPVKDRLDPEDLKIRLDEIGFGDVLSSRINDRYYIITAIKI